MTEKTFLYQPKGATRASSEVTMFKMFTVPLVATLAGAFINSVAFAGGAALGLGYAVWLWRTRHDVGGAQLDVDGRTLLVRLDGPRSDPKRIALDDLLNVSLDSKSFSPVQEGSAMIPGTRFIDQKSGDEIEESRIVLSSRGEPDLPLTEARGSYSEAIEWLGKIRTFLRKNGWIPEDERPAEA